MSTTFDPMPSGFDFMVQPSATYINIKQFEIILTLLEEYVDPSSIPEYVRKRVPGVDLTVQDVKAIKDGHFHVSAPGIYMRMMNSGNLITSDLVDDFFIVLAAMPSLHHMRSYIEEEYGFVIDDDDLIDLYDNSFTVAGPKATDITTENTNFVASTFCSELLWVYARNCSGEFLSKYMWYKFHCHILPNEIFKLAFHNLMGSTDALLGSITYKSLSPSSFQPPTLKQTPRRRQPPLPIVTAVPVPSKTEMQAEQVQGGTYTANPIVLCHNDDGSYTTIADFASDLINDGEALMDDTNPSPSHFLGKSLYRLIRPVFDDSDDGSASRCDSDLDIIESGSCDCDCDGHCELDSDPSSNSDSSSDFSIDSCEFARIMKDQESGNLMADLCPTRPGLELKPTDINVDTNTDTEDDDDLRLAELNPITGEQHHEDLVYSSYRAKAKKFGSGSSLYVHPLATVEHSIPMHIHGTCPVSSDQGPLLNETTYCRSRVLFDQEAHSENDDQSSDKYVDLEPGLTSIEPGVELDLESGNTFADQHSQKKNKRRWHVGGCARQVQ